MKYIGRLSHLSFLFQLPGDLTTQLVDYVFPEKKYVRITWKAAAYYQADIYKHINTTFFWRLTCYLIFYLFYTFHLVTSSFVYLH